jgi:hypothetical protein
MPRIENTGIDDFLGDGGLSESKPTPTDPDESERQTREDFSRRFAAGEYRRWFDRLYPRWESFKRQFFGDEVLLTRPRISIGPTSPRRLSETRLTTDYGARINIVLAERMMFMTDRRLVKTDNPNAEGLVRLTVDRLLGEMVKQLVLQVHGTTEESWDGYGPLYAREATRIGEIIGLPEVYPRRRGPRLAGMPVAASWPHAFRPDGYYMGHICLDHSRSFARTHGRALRQSVVPGVFEYFHFLLMTGKLDRLADILGREVDAAKVARQPTLAAFERNPHDSSGMPLPLPVIEPGWLTWNSGCVLAMAEGILTRRSFDGMPILADALQDAGCEDEVLLGHLRAYTDHTANCWTLRLIIEPK